MDVNYKNLFKSRIKKEVIKSGGDKSFVDGLFDMISADIYNAGQSIGLDEVDDKTLESYFEIAKKEYLSLNPIDPGISHSLMKKGFKTWLDQGRIESITWNYSNRYFELLARNGRSNKVVSETKRSSLSILKKLADPNSNNKTYIKGLVVGAVQSGKTGNFNAVINRAIDTGYKLIIVLSGIMEDLRSQTQKRIESDVIGEGIDDSTLSSGAKGVGKISRFGPLGNSDIIQVKSITSVERDFGKSTKELDFTLNDKYVLVCKKNVSVLRNLIVWLHDCLETGKEQHNIPLLLLDDEADNASLNNAGAKGRNYASKTNGQIRALLALFKVKSYLGYTATPFANVLQDRNGFPEHDWRVRYKFKGDVMEKELKQEANIFPDDFIELLDPPSNYIGAKQIFETIKPIENATDENEKIPLIAPAVNDHIENFPARVYVTAESKTVGVQNFANKDEWDDKIGLGGYLDFDTYREYRKGTRAARKEDNFPFTLPESLKDAIKCFILTLAIKESRRPKMENSFLYNPHSTMLVHISRFTLWQNTTKNLITKFTEEIVSRINNEVPFGEGSIYHELEKTWYQYYASIVENIKSYLPKGYEDPFMAPVVYDSLKSYLPDAVKKIEIKAINSFTKEKLSYPRSSQKKIIAIGGNRLSRGFTLEGLTINYFVRRTNYSDTLLQMGRWFGYRPGYLDCCKIFTTQDSIDKFNSTTICIEELEEEFKKMEEQERDPSSFVLRVRKHPGALKITRPSILKNAIEVKWSYQDQLEMTTRFRVTRKHIEGVWNNFRENISPKFSALTDGLLTYNTSGSEVVDILTKQLNNFDEHRQKTMAQFIQLCNKKNLLNNWTIALKITGNSPRKLLASELNINVSPKLISNGIGLAKRSGPGIGERNIGDVSSFLKEKIFKASGKNANIISANSDLAILLSAPEKELAKETFYLSKAREIQKKDKSISFDKAMALAKEKKTIPERYYRERIPESQGLLIIYLFDSYFAFNQKGRNSKDLNHKQKFREYIKKNEIDEKIPLVGYAIGFPPIENDPGGIYMKGDYKLDVDEIDVDNEVEEGVVPTDIDD